MAFNRQVSETSSGPMIREADCSVPRSTSIPIREEFRVRRFWFFYHDVRALTTSWMPPPVFVVYRLLIFLYALAWLILHAEARRESRYLIFITNQSYIILVLGLGLMAGLTLGYTILYFTHRQRLSRYYPTLESSVYMQDNLLWYMKVCWMVYVIGATLALAVTAGFYTTVIDYSCSDDDAAQPVNATSGDGDRPCRSLDTVDVYSAHIHGVNALLVLIDVFLTRIPYQLFHVIYPLSYSILYVIFTLIYYAAGGTNEFGERFIYSNLNYTEPRSAGGVAALVFVSLPFYIILFLLAWLRDVCSKRIACCFRDILREEHKEFNTDV